MTDQTIHGVECYQAWREMEDCPHEIEDDRCQACGWHLDEDGHEPGCGNATPDEVCHGSGTCSCRRCDPLVTARSGPAYPVRVTDVSDSEEQP